MPFGDFSLHRLCGLDCLWTKVSWLVPVSVVSGARSRLMFMLLFQLSHLPFRRFSHVHLDIVGPLPSSNGFTYLLTMINRTSCWPEVTLLSSIPAESCVRAFLFTWVVGFVVPSVLTSDLGAQSTSSVWSRVSCSLGIFQSTTTSFYPQSNCIIKGFHRSLKTALRACLTGLDWFLHLLLVLLGLHSVSKEDTGFSVSKTVF